MCENYAVLLYGFQIFTEELLFHISPIQSRKELANKYKALVFINKSIESIVTI